MCVVISCLTKIFFPQLNFSNTYISHYSVKIVSYRGVCLKGRGLSQDGTKREQRLPAGIFIMQEGNVGGVHITYV